MKYKICVMKNAFYAQSGGVTSVINSSAYGVLSQIKESTPESKIFASKNGIVGLLENELYDMQKTKKPLELLLESPAGMFGSCRYKLPGLEDEDFYKSLHLPTPEVCTYMSRTFLLEILKAIQVVFLSFAYHKARFLRGPLCHFLMQKFLTLECSL